MFLCQHGRIYVKTRKMNVFVKPNEQCRACSNIVMARKRAFRGKRKERLTRPLAHSSTRQLVSLSTRQPVYLSTRQLANPPTRQLVNSNIVHFSARNSTSKVPFLSTNHPPCRKKSILAKVCFDVKRG